MKITAKRASAVRAIIAATICTAAFGVPLWRYTLIVVGMLALESWTVLAHRHGLQFRGVFGVLGAVYHRLRGKTAAQFAVGDLVTFSDGSGIVIEVVPDASDPEDSR